MWFDTLRKEDSMIREYFDFLSERAGSQAPIERNQKRLDAGEDIVDLIIEEIKNLEIDNSGKIIYMSKERRQYLQNNIDKLKEILR